MASSREMQPSSRPLTHRPTLSGSSTTTLPAKTHTRANSHSSHSLLTNSLNPNHRVTRRKSVTNPAANLNALAAALRDTERSLALPISTSSSRRHTVSKLSTGRSGLVGSLPSPPPSFPNKTDMNKSEIGGSAIDDKEDTSSDEGSDKLQKARIRRASDGQPLTKEGKKSSRVELRCKQCGKGYKHSSCLTKHLWEHTPEWSYTSKLLISKHQQVQLLEAASVLVQMNGPEGDSATTPPDSAKDFPSDPESAASPAASGYSEVGDRQSSADTTPPPSSEGPLLNAMAYRNKRHSSIGGLSRSYQSAPFASSPVQGRASGSNGFGHSRHLSVDNRPTSSGFNTTGQEDRDLAAAVELLSCSFGSNSGSRGTVTLPDDAPPVPPVPTQYLSQANSLTPASFINSFPSRQPESFTRGDFRRGSEDVKTDEQMDSVMDDDDYDTRSRARSDEDDDGVFGRMEE